MKYRLVNKEQARKLLFVSIFLSILSIVNFSVFQIDIVFFLSPVAHIALFIFSVIMLLAIKDENIEAGMTKVLIASMVINVLSALVFGGILYIIILIGIATYGKSF